jgi:hypothetical protein
MKVSLTEFQRNFRRAREAADKGDTVIVKGEHGDYLFERRTVASDHPFAGLEGVFGAVSLGRREGSIRAQVRSRLAAKNRHGAFSGKVDTGFPKENATKHRI